MERRNEQGDTPRKAGTDVHKRDLKDEIDCTDGRARGNQARTGGSGGLVDILTRMSLDQDGN